PRPVAGREGGQGGAGVVVVRPLVERERERAGAAAVGGEPGLGGQLLAAGEDQNRQRRQPDEPAAGHERCHVRPPLRSTSVAMVMSAGGLKVRSRASASPARSPSSRRTPASRAGAPRARAAAASRTMDSAGT